MRVDYLTYGPSKQLENALKGKYRLLWQVGVCTGLRVSDVLNITAEQAQRGRFVVKEQKTGKKRNVYIKKAIQREICDYIEKNSIKNNEKIFDCSRQAAWKAFKRAARRAGLQTNIGTHSMRKSFGVAYLGAGHNLKELQKQYNHDFIGDTMNYITSNEALGLDEYGKPKKNKKERIKK